METKVKQTSENDNIDFSGFISGAAYMFPRDNGNPAGLEALRISLKRSEQNSFERLSECLHVNHGKGLSND